MSLRWLLYGLIGIGIVLMLFALDRLLLWMEKRGWLYYRTKHGSGGAASGVLTSMQQFVEPQVQHVIEMKEEAKQQVRRDQGQPGQVDDPVKNDRRPNPKTP
jgi:hypothetical protein